MKFVFLFLILFIFSGCTVYTEKRSEALSQAVAATSDSIFYARFDLAEKYAKESEKLAYPPKNRIPIKPIVTQDKPKITIETPKNSVLSIPASDSNLNINQDSSVLRLVIPEHLKHAKLLVENSIEWQELIKNTEFAETLKKDYDNLKTLQNDVNAELHKQLLMNNKMIDDLNKMQRNLLEKDLAILRRNIAIAILMGTIGVGIYLRIKGVL